MAVTGVKPVLFDSLEVRIGMGNPGPRSPITRQVSAEDNGQMKGPGRLSRQQYFGGKHKG